MSSVFPDKTDITVSGREKILLLLLLVLLLLVFRSLFAWETVSDVVPDVVTAFFSVSGVAPQYLYVLVAGLLFIRRDDIAVAYQNRGEPWSAAAFLIPGVCLYFWGLFVNAPDLVHVSFVLVAFGGARFLSGRQLTRVLLAPILILLIGTPLPAVLINQIIFPLQLWDTVHSVWLLNAIGIPAAAKGDMISMAESSTHFAESCTALGFTLWLTIFALAYVYIFRITRWHAVLLLLSAPVIAYTVNILRAFSLVLNPAMEVLTIHTLQGIVFFLIGFSLLYTVDSLLMRVVGDRSPSVRTFIPDVNDQIVTARQKRLLVLVCLAAMLVPASFAMPQWSAPAVGDYPRVTLPDRIGDWKKNITLTVRLHFIGSVRYSSSVYQSYSNGKDGVSIFVGADDRLRRQRSLLSGKNAYSDAIGLEQERLVVDLGPGIGQASAVVSDYGPNRILTYHWYEGVESTLKEILYALFALDQSPFRRDYLATVTRVTTNVELVPGGRAQADKRLRSFLQDLRRTVEDDRVALDRLPS